MKVLVEITVDTFLELQLQLAHLKKYIGEKTTIPDYRIENAQAEYEQRVFSLANSHLFIDSNIGEVHMWIVDFPEIVNRKNKTNGNA